jgi:hypothetical protein
LKTNKKGIPLANLLEYAEKSPYKLWAQKVFNQSKEIIYQAIIGELKKVDITI